MRRRAPGDRHRPCRGLPERNAHTRRAHLGAFGHGDREGLRVHPGREGENARCGLRYATWCRSRKSLTKRPRG